jgi:hypothetical protein
VEKMGFVLLGFLSSCRELPFGGSGVQLWNTCPKDFFKHETTNNNINATLPESHVCTSH